MKAILKIILQIIFLINYISSIHFDLSKEEERCIIEELFSNTVGSKLNYFIYY